MLQETVFFPRARKAFSIRDKARRKIDAAVSCVFVLFCFVLSLPSKKFTYFYLKSCTKAENDQNKT